MGETVIKLYAGLELTEEEIAELRANHTVVNTTYGDVVNQQIEAQKIIAIFDDFWAIDYMEGLADDEDNDYYLQPYRVKPIKKKIEVVEYVPIED